MRVDRAVLFALHPKWIPPILRRDKGWEYRRQAPTIDPPYRALFYATHDVGAVVATAIVRERYRAEPMKVIVNTTDDKDVERRAELKEYLLGAGKANALSLANPRRMGNPVQLSDLREAGLDAPQNFQYITRDHADIFPIDEEVLFLDYPICHHCGQKPLAILTNGPRGEVSSCCNAPVHHP